MPATAEEQTLKGRLVVTQPTGASTTLPSFGGHTFVAKSIRASRCSRMAVSPISSTLNRATTPRRVETSRVTAPTPSKTVDSLTMSYTGGWKGNGYTGEYEVLSGTGAYAGASGSGAFKSVDESWQDASMADVTLKLTLATR